VSRVAVQFLSWESEERFDRMSSFVLLSDDPVLGSSEDPDWFGFRASAEVLCRAIADADSVWLTIAIFAPWGSGKSSFLNMCREELRSEDEARVLTAQFNAWKYDGRDEVWHALIQTLLDELVRHSTDPQNHLSRRRLHQALGVARDLSMSAAWLLPEAALTFGTAKTLDGSIVERFRGDLRQRSALRAENDKYTLGYRHINRFERDFASTVKTLAGDRRLVLFIDDLDRCSPESAMTVLEALRLFTGAANCVFVVAMDERAITEAAAAAFQPRDEAKGRRYLAKLINFACYLPSPRFESIRSNIDPHLAALSKDNTFWELVEVSFGSNPRLIKRFVNAFNLAIETLALARHAPYTTMEQRKVAVWVMLRQEHPAFAERLRSDPGVWNRLVAQNRDTVGDLGGTDQDLTRSDPSLLDKLGSISHRRKEFSFPPPLTPSDLEMLTEAIVALPAVLHAEAQL
jgi:KAP family P-loop domain